MTSRMTSPVFVLPDALPAMLAVSASLADAGLAPTTAKLVHLRVSQINGCAYCIDMHAKELRQLGETDERLWGVAAWRETAFFDDAERAALALAESATRLADTPEAVPDAVWDDARAHYDAKALSALILEIAVINAWNRINVTTRQIAGKRRAAAPAAA